MIDFLKLFVYLDVSPQLGWNWFSILCIIIMGCLGLRWHMKKYNPPGKFNRMPLILTLSVCSVLFYYSFLDLFPVMMANSLSMLLHGNNPLIFLSQFICQHFIPQVVPANFIFLSFYFGIIWFYDRSYMNWKYLLVMFVYTFIVNFSMIYFLGSYNIRVFDNVTRILLYYFAFIPSWMVYVIGYNKLWRKE